ncbi:DUF6879 family protein [Promicromonospora alba]|uniref:DUF6879 family protein n=1 Tax=Promicromonospora alba TaxID=1616110 RepID=A0ABV9HL20_9MICO
MTSELIQPGREFGKLFDEFDHTAYRLEVREAYNEPSEKADLRRYTEAGWIDRDRTSDWLRYVRRVTAAGVRFHRVRVVSLPLSTYNEWGVLEAEATNRAGDDIRYLRRDQAGDLPDHDYWLLDSKVVARMHFTDNDRFLGFELIEDPAVVVEHNYWRDVAWHHAVPRGDFAKQHIQQL